MLASSRVHYRRRVAPLKPKGKAAHRAIAVYLTHHDSMVLATCCHQPGTLSFFSALMLLIGLQEGYTVEV